ncbi:serine hydrolase domain-containing protein [Corynebacterium hansenii]|uniref:Serine hydrolase domain-containing protein n=1 Tax=Corynebacterium hansenii TaxID=394964 RepID=A0ABV7ZPQ4_9CORY|nr:serine hydrolase domain-containing protein [Corynebacterium hansenii]WJZ00753.1 beta-lactamase/D-alanine carboxypeptidase [Corynebacterium hansenii]
MTAPKFISSLRGNMAAPIAALGVAVLSLAASVAVPPRPQLPDDAHGDQAIAETVRPHLDGVRREVAALVVDRDGAREALFGTTATTPYYIGSVTKLFTIELYNESVRRGEVAPDTTLGSLLPMEDSPAAMVTLDELAHHEGGFGEWGADDDFRPGVRDRLSARLLHTEPREHTTIDELYDRARRDPLTGRGNYHYSNIGIALLGHALAEAAETTYPELLKERLLEPLNMRYTGFPGPDNLNPPRGLEADGAHAPVWDLGAYAPAGGAVSTLMDLGLFARYVASSPDPDVGAPGSRAVHRGFRVTGLDGRRVLTKVGTVAGFQAVVLVDPEAGRTVVMLSDSWNAILDAAQALMSDENARQP